jgi:uncharacterized membrane protein
MATDVAVAVAMAEAMVGSLVTGVAVAIDGATVDDITVSYYQLEMLHEPVWTYRFTHFSFFLCRSFCHVFSGNDED